MPAWNREQHDCRVSLHASHALCTIFRSSGRRCNFNLPKHRYARTHIPNQSDTCGASATDVPTFSALGLLARHRQGAQRSLSGRQAGQFLEGSFSAVPKPKFAKKSTLILHYFRALQDLHTFVQL